MRNEMARKKLIFTLRFLFSALLFSFFTKGAFAQAKVIDQVIAVVGKQIILQSEIETQYLQFLSQGNKPDLEIKCSLIDQMLLQKLMINQSEIDSVTVPDNQVDGEIERRIRYFVSQIGSEQKLEEYYKKSIAEIKNDFRDIIRDQLLAQTMQGRITKEITVSPSEVKTYFRAIHPDSIPYINSELEIEQIVRQPIVSKEQKDGVIEQLNGIRKKIIDGSSFAVMAGLYSKDPGTARKGGELGFMNRGDLVSEFAAVAFSLKENEVSKVFETEFGFHIVQLIERKGSQANFRHILLKPEVTQASIAAAGFFIDSIKTLILSGNYSFDSAATKFSDDQETRNNGGILINQAAGNTRFEADQLDPAIFFVIDKLRVGDISAPVMFQTLNGLQAYRLLRLKTRTLPHRASLQEDYQKIQNAALVEKQNKVLNEWVDKKKKVTYIKLHDDYKNCEALQYWSSNQNK